jgi:hypothetical protein
LTLPETIQAPTTSASDKWGPRGRLRISQDQAAFLADLLNHAELLLLEERAATRDQTEDCIHGWFTDTVRQYNQGLTTLRDLREYVRILMEEKGWRPAE